MTELVCELITTIDAMAKGNNSPGYYGYGGQEFMAFLTEKQAQPHRNLLGKKTLQLLSDLPQEAKDEPYRQMANHPGWVLSTTLTSSSWPGLEVIADDLVGHVRAWKNDGGPEIRTIGSLSLVRQLIAAGEVDRLRLIMCPLVLPQTGSEPVFEGYDDTSFELLDLKTLDQRVLVMDYRPKGDPPRA